MASHPPTISKAFGGGCESPSEGAGQEHRVSFSGLEQTANMRVCTGVMNCSQ